MVTESGQDLELEHKSWASQPTAQQNPWTSELVKKSRDELVGAWEGVTKGQGRFTGRTSLILKFLKRLFLKVGQLFT